jgi:hypothetical protein
MRDLIAALDISGIDFDELLLIFHDHYGSSAQSETETEYRRGRDTPALRVRHTAKGEIKGIEACKAWQASDLGELQCRIAEFKSQPGKTDVVQRYVFTRFEMARALTVEGWFAFLPVPHEAPRSALVYGSAPAVIEVAYTRTTNTLIAGQRRQKALNEVELLLNVLYKWGVQSRPNGPAEWGILSGAEGSASVPVHLGYSWPSMVDSGGKFSDLGCYQSFEQIPPERYYTEPATFSLDGTDLPAIGTDFLMLLGNYRSLASEPRNRFLQAAYWFQYSDKVRTLSNTASFLALVQSIEALIEDPREEEPCKTCNHLPGAVRRFHDFVERHAAGVDKKQRDKIYSVRSRIVHSGRTLRIDAAVFDMNPKQLAELKQHGLLVQLVRRILRNWLAEQH